MVGTTVIRQRQGPKELVPGPRVLRHVVVEDRMLRGQRQERQGAADLGVPNGGRICGIPEG